MQYGIMKQDVGYANYPGLIARKGDKVIVEEATNQPEPACSNSVFVAAPDFPEYSILVEKELVELLQNTTVVCYCVR